MLGRLLECSGRHRGRLVKRHKLKELLRYCWIACSKTRKFGRRANAPSLDITISPAMRAVNTVAGRSRPSLASATLAHLPCRRGLPVVAYAAESNRQLGFSSTIAKPIKRAAQGDRRAPQGCPFIGVASRQIEFACSITRKIGGGGGNRTRVRKHSAKSSTCLFRL